MSDWNAMRRMIRIGLFCLLAGTVLALFLSRLVYFSEYSVETRGRSELTDFDAFQIAGQMVRQGQAIAAYDRTRMEAAQRERIDFKDNFMPWSYPPQFDLVVGALAFLPQSLGYLLLTGMGCLAFLFMIRKIAGEHWETVFLIGWPTVLSNIFTGQNGFLTGALLASTCWLTLENRRIAGLPLGLMVIKPHLAVLFAWEALLRRRWNVIAIAFAVVLASSLLATAILGMAVWPAFVSGVDTTRTFLEAGFYPHQFMVSPFAWVKAAEQPALMAWGVQSLTMLVLLVLIGLSVHRKMPIRQSMGIAALASSFFSPYAYHYDMTVIILALALLASDLFRRMSRLEWIALVVLVQGIMLNGYVWNIVHLMNPAGGSSADLRSWGAPGLFALTVMIWRVLQRDVVPEPRLQPA